jgi:hypothetical protein
MTQKQKDAVIVLDKIREQWWDAIEGHTNLSEEDYITILEAIFSNNEIYYYPYISHPLLSEPIYQKEYITTCD